jgi:hypothetical protein
MFQNLKYDDFSRRIDALLVSFRNLSGTSFNGYFDFEPQASNPLFWFLKMLQDLGS